MSLKIYKLFNSLEEQKEYIVYFKDFHLIIGEDSEKPDLKSSLLILDDPKIFKLSFKLENMIPYIKGVTFYLYIENGKIIIADKDDKYSFQNPLTKKPVYYKDKYDIQELCIDSPIKIKKEYFEYAKTDIYDLPLYDSLTEELEDFLEAVAFADLIYWDFFSNNYIFHTFVFDALEPNLNENLSWRPTEEKLASHLNFLIKNAVGRGNESMIERIEYYMGNRYVYSLNKDIINFLYHAKGLIDLALENKILTIKIINEDKIKKFPFDVPYYDDRYYYFDNGHTFKERIKLENELFFSVEGKYFLDLFNCCFINPDIDDVIYFKRE